MPKESFEPISPQNRALLQAALNKLYSKRKMGKSPYGKQPQDPDNAYERNKAFLRSGQYWLIREGLNWQKGQRDWVQVGLNDEGMPTDLWRTDEY